MHAVRLNAMCWNCACAGVENYKAVITPRPCCSAHNSPYSTYAGELQHSCCAATHTSVKIGAAAHCCMSDRQTKRGNAVASLATQKHTQALNHAQSRALDKDTPPRTRLQQLQDHSSAHNTHMLQQQLRRAGTRRWWRTAQHKDNSNISKLSAKWSWQTPATVVPDMLVLFAPLVAPIMLLHRCCHMQAKAGQLAPQQDQGWQTLLKHPRCAQPFHFPPSPAGHAYSRCCSRGC